MAAPTTSPRGLRRSPMLLTRPTRPLLPSRPTRPMRPRRGPLAAAFVPVAALLLALPARAAPDAAGAPKTFHFAGTGFRSLDPAMSSTPLEERLSLACFEPLTTLDAATGKVLPGAAASWEASADGRRWTFQIRPGAKWVRTIGCEDKGQ